MAFGDRTGPNGAGPMTGRGAGFCAGYDRPGYANPAGGRYGRGFARGGGRGRGGFGFGRGFAYGRGYGPNFERYPYTYAPAPISKEDEKKFLKNEAELLEKELEATKKRLNEIENDKQ